MKYKYKESYIEWHRSMIFDRECRKHRCKYGSKGCEHILHGVNKHNNDNSNNEKKWKKNGNYN
jgi:hypothetical protein